MNTIYDSPIHNFHIPVLGLCFSIDTPLKVAQFGISSVVSIIEDELIEDMRSYHALKNGVDFVPITKEEPDYRAKRITAYLDMMDILVKRQVTRLKAASFSAGSDLVRYFELLPDTTILKDTYRKMIGLAAGEEKNKLQEKLRASVTAGSIDVNIMAKVDNSNYNSSGELLPDEYSDALSALRGYAKSTLRSSIVFSAGYNPRLYNYVANFNDFFPDTTGNIRKQIILKVSDYRSALIQGKIFAKKGLWVSEFRIESGLNCGGHAFPTDGVLLGPILEEFKTHRSAMYTELLHICRESLLAAGKNDFQTLPTLRISVQGGIGTAEEQSFLLQHYGLDSIGWGSPFLLVPEATNVDEQTLKQLSTARQEDYYLSEASPLGVPFNNFRHSSSEAQRKERIEKKRPGSPCYKNYLASNTEFTDKPICTASRKYQFLKANQLMSEGEQTAEIKAKLKEISEKDCLCEGLTTSVRIKNSMYLPHKLSAVAICPGPNLAYFSGVFSLKEMVDHIYGRINILNSLQRPHMFINELKLYIDYFKKKIKTDIVAINDKQEKYYQKCKTNLLNGISYYLSTFDKWHMQETENELKQMAFQVTEL